jgi:TolA-binding protein
MKTTIKERSCLSQREVKQYLRGNLNRSQQQAVEHHLLDCPLCAHAIDGLEAASRQGQLETELAQLPQSPLRKSRYSPLKRWGNWAAAAAIALLVAFSVGQYRSAQANEHLFAAHFNAAEPAYLVLRSAQPGTPLSSEAELNTAVAYYQAGQYEESLPHFQNHLEAHPDDDEAYFLMANALLGQRKGSRAELLLQQLYDDPSSIVSPEKTQWYLALAHVLQGEKEAAKSLLWELSDSKSYPRQAQALLEEL